LIFFGFIGICAIVAAVRSARMLVRAINKLFDKLEAKFH
jgi:hypothetical protein